MTIQTLLFIFFAFLVSVILATYQYAYKTKFTTKAKWIYGSLRFITFFSFFILLINPKFKTNSYFSVKPSLPVLIDNSESINEFNQGNKVIALIKTISENRILNDKFDVEYYTFGTELKLMDSLIFDEKTTNIYDALNLTNSIYKQEIAPTLFVTDGNQTLGSDYEYIASQFKNPIYPIIVGDSIKYSDLKIESIFSNRYTFLKNQFPVELTIVYQGTSPVKSNLEIKRGSTLVHRQSLTFSETDNAKIIQVILPSSEIGLQKYSAQIYPLTNEKNTQNNTKEFAVEVIDQSTNILLVSDIKHPDVGVIKKSIESNEQRIVTINTPDEALKNLIDSQLIVLYQPNRNFSALFQEIKKLNKNTFTFTGLQTDWSFLNSNQINFNKEITNQKELSVGDLNANFSYFLTEDIGFLDFRPLNTFFGTLTILNKSESLLDQYINGYRTESPLLAIIESNLRREAIWDGEGLWKWRAQSFIESQDHRKFDLFMGNIIQYLASNKKRSRLELNFKNIYYNNNSIKISAQFFDKNFVFNPNANISITIKNIETKESFISPLILKENYYEIDLSTMEAGDYSFSVILEDDVKLTRTGTFTIFDYHIEQQFLNADVTKLTRLATNTNGDVSFLSDSYKVLEDLANNDSFKQIQKKSEIIKPLIEFKYILMLIIISLSLEWLMRKYNGLT